MNRLYRHLMPSILFVLIFAVSALAQPEQGDKEALLHGDVTSVFGSGTSSSTVGNIDGGLGYYFTPKMELFGSLNFSISNDAMAGTSLDAGFGTSFRYNFAKSERKTVPYVGVEYSLDSLRSPKDSSFVRPNLGFKYYLRRNTAFDFNVNYGHAMFSSRGGNVVSESIGLVFAF